MSSSSASNSVAESPSSVTTPSNPTTSVGGVSDFKDKPVAQPGYLKMAVSGVASGLYSVGEAFWVQQLH